MNNPLDLAKHIPLIAIIRGVEPSEVIEVTSVLIEAGFTMIEVPLNSPNALVSIKKLVDEFGTNEYFIGAGTVTTPALAEQVINTGANLVVTPNCDVQVIKMCVAAGCATFPGVVTPTEAFTAHHAGATGLKLFPVSMVGIDGMKAMLSVLPSDIGLYPVGGISPNTESMKPFIEAGAKGFGLGSALYKSTMTLAEISDTANTYMRCYKQCI